MNKIDSRHRGKTVKNNLPFQLTSFIGREKEVEEVQRLLSETRLLSLIGAGGVGKTRLGLEVVNALQDIYEDGIWFVELAPLSDPELIIQEILQVIGMRDESKVSGEEFLSSYLYNQNLLLVLDNCEHLIVKSAEISEHLLRTCPQVIILITSREPLGIAGETQYRVPSLSLPEKNQLKDLEEITQNEAVQLFLERAETVQPDFKVTPSMANAIGRICIRLDGIPLAIELAAKRVPMLPVKQIEARLNDRFEILTGGSRTALPHQRTLYGTIEWSYNLLSEDEKTLFRQLAVFPDRFTLKAVETICTDLKLDNGSEDHFIPRKSDSVKPQLVHPAQALDLLFKLAEKSLILVAQGEEPSYRMLESIHQFAGEKLDESGEEETIRNRHLVFFLQFAENAALNLTRSEQTAWLEKLEAENENIRSALTWTLKAGELKSGARLAIAMRNFWRLHGYYYEGNQWFARLLAREGYPEDLRAKLQLHAGLISMSRGSHEEAIIFGEESLKFFQAHRDRFNIAHTKFLLGTTSVYQGDREKGIGYLEESLITFRDFEDECHIANTLLVLTEVHIREGDLENGAVTNQESLSIFKRIGDPWGIAFALSSAGEIARKQGDIHKATDYHKQSLSIHWQQKHIQDSLYLIEFLAIIAVIEANHQHAAKLWGAADVLRQSFKIPLQILYQQDYAGYIDKVRQSLGKEEFTSAWQEGEKLSLEEAIELAAPGTITNQDANSTSTTDSPPSAPPVSEVEEKFGLTKREVDVLRQVALVYFSVLARCKSILNQSTGSSISIHVPQPHVSQSDTN
jgi:non-specific serine/threonine protein kinase